MISHFSLQTVSLETAAFVFVFVVYHEAYKTNVLRSVLYESRISPSLSNSVEFIFSWRCRKRCKVTEMREKSWEGKKENAVQYFFAQVAPHLFPQSTLHFLLLWCKLRQCNSFPDLKSVANENWDRMKRPFTPQRLRVSQSHTYLSLSPVRFRFYYCFPTFFLRLALEINETFFRSFFLRQNWNWQIILSPPCFRLGKCACNRL